MADWRAVRESGDVRPYVADMVTISRPVVHARLRPNYDALSFATSSASRCVCFKPLLVCFRCLHSSV